ncbi:MAG: HAD-IB family phosphatase [Pseudomonas sp.]|uniref:HAD-IB family phosphatase n=1 Tax=Pseudomonas sp. TaxID=306 RepID=UPI003398E10C
MSLLAGAPPAAQGPLSLEPALERLSVFDFDGTLSYRDSFVPFLRFAFGTYRFGLRLTASGSPRYLYGGVSRDVMKARLIRSFLRGVSLDWFEERAQAFCQQQWTRMMRPAGLLAVASELEQGRLVSLCSASPAFMLRPFAQRLGVNLIGTNLEVVDGLLTGELIGRNCRRDEKVLRLIHAYGPLEQYHLRAWGNSSGDTELLAAAQESFWRPFR